MSPFEQEVRQAHEALPPSRPRPASLRRELWEEVLLSTWTERMAMVAALGLAVIFVVLFLALGL